MSHTWEAPPKGAVPIKTPDYSELWFAVRALALGALIGLAFGLLLVVLVT